MCHKKFKKTDPSICVSWCLRFQETVLSGPFDLRCNVLAFSGNGGKTVRSVSFRGPSRFFC